MFRVRSLIRRLFTSPEKEQGGPAQMMPAMNGGLPQMMPSAPQAPKPDLSQLSEALAQTPRATREQDGPSLGR